MHNPESVLENETNKILGDFEIQTDHQIPTTRQDLVIINKKVNLLNSWLCRLGGWQSKNVKIKETLGLCQKTKKKVWNLKVTVIPIIIGALGTVPKNLINELEQLEIVWRAEIIQTTALLTSRRLGEAFYLSDSSERPSTNTGVKILQRIIIKYKNIIKISHEVINFIEKNHENLESGADSRRKKLSWNKDPKRYFPRGCTITLTFPNSHDAT